MHILEISDLTQRVQEIAFGLSIIISGFFLLEYKKYTEAQERKDMIDKFLNDH